LPNWPSLPKGLPVIAEPGAHNSSLSMEENGAAFPREGNTLSISISGKNAKCDGRPAIRAQVQRGQV
jgi:hypothetical protein